MKSAAEGDLVCQRKELFKYLFEISNYAHESELILRNEVAFSEVLENILKMKLIAKNLLNLLNENFHLKESREPCDIVKDLGSLKFLKKKPKIAKDTTKMDNSLLEHTTKNELSDIVKICPKDSEKEITKFDDSLVLDFIKGEIEFSPEGDTNIQIKTDDQPDLKNEISAMKFVCDHCTFRTDKFVNMKRHVRDSHNLKYESFLNTHNILYTFKCDFCEEKCKSNIAGTKHVENVHPEHWDDYVAKYRIHQCDQCISSFFTKKRLKYHVLKVHKIINDEMLGHGKFNKNRYDQLPQKAKRKCNYCPKILSNLTAYTDHLLVHEMGDKPFNCDQCPFRSNRRRSLSAHKKQHIVSTLLCKNCGIITNSQYELKAHTKKFHKVTNKSDDIIFKKLDFQVTCDVCAKSFRSKGSLRSHMLVHQDEGNKPICDICGQKTINQHNLENHRLLHFPPTIKCDECDKLFHTPEYLKRHKDEAHTNVRKFNCEQCGKGFNSKCTFRGHMNMHLGIKPYKCRYCEMVYQNLSNCMAHEKRVHKDLYVGRSNNSIAVRVRKKETKSTKDVFSV